MYIIKRTGIIEISEEGEAQEICLKISGTKLGNIKRATIPLRWKPTHYVNIYKDLEPKKKT
jgi:hypothetical protein